MVSEGCKIISHIIILLWIWDPVSPLWSLHAKTLITWVLIRFQYTSLVCHHDLSFYLCTCSSAWKNRQFLSYLAPRFQNESSSNPFMWKGDRFTWKWTWRLDIFSYEKYRTDTSFDTEGKANSERPIYKNQLFYLFFFVEVWFDCKLHIKL